MTTPDTPPPPPVIPSLSPSAPLLAVAGPPTGIGKIAMAINGGKPFSKKVIAAGLAWAITTGVAYVVTRQGWHLSPTVSQEITYAAGLLGVLGGGWLAKEEGLNG